MLKQLFGKTRSVQDLIGVKSFTKYGLATDKYELLFYQESYGKMLGKMKR